MKAKSKRRNVKKTVCQHDALITASLAGNLVLVASIIGLIFSIYGVTV